DRLHRMRFQQDRKGEGGVSAHSGQLGYYRVSDGGVTPLESQSPCCTAMSAISNSTSWRRTVGCVDFYPWKRGFRSQGLRVGGQRLTTDNVDLAVHDARREPTP